MARTSMRSRSSLAGILLAGFLLDAICAPVPPPVKTGKATRADEFFASTNIVRIRLEIPPAGIAALRRTSWGHGNERPVVRITVREGTTVYTNVTAHLKGAAGSFRPVDQNPGFTLNFDKLAPGQSFHGLEKLSLNNSVQD